MYTFQIFQILEPLSSLALETRPTLTNALVSLAFELKKLPSKHSSWWRHLEDVLKTSFVFVFRRRLQDIFKTSYQDVFKTSSKRLQHVFQKRLQDVLPRRLPKTSSRHLQDVLKSFSRRLAKMSSRRFQDLSSSYAVLVNKFSRCLQDVFTTFLRCAAKIDLPVYLDR